MAIAKTDTRPHVSLVTGGGTPAQRVLRVVALHNGQTVESLAADLRTHSTPSALAGLALFGPFVHGASNNQPKIVSL